MVKTFYEGVYNGENLKVITQNSITLCSTKHAKKSCTNLHKHQNKYLSILLRGNYVEKNNTSESIVKPGDVLFRPENYIHQNYFKEENVICVNIEFSMRLMEKYQDQFTLPDKMINFKLGMTPSLVQMLIEFMRNGQTYMIEDILADLLFHLERKELKLRQPWLVKLQNFLDNELSVFHSLDFLSGKVGVHPVYLARAFKQNTGLTVGQYQLKAKLANAVKLLMNTRMPIGQISFLNGFFDDPHFINSFKSYYGFSPHKFRLILKG